MQVNKRKDNTFLCVVASLLLSRVLGTSLAFAGLLPLSLAHEAPGHQDFQMPSAHVFPLDSYFLFKIRISLNFRCSHAVTKLQWVPSCSLSRISEGIARNCVPFLFSVEINCVPPLSMVSRKPQTIFIVLSIFQHFFLFNFFSSPLFWNQSRGVRKRKSSPVMLLVFKHSSELVVCYSPCLRDSRVSYTDCKDLQLCAMAHQHSLLKM